MCVVVTGIHNREREREEWSSFGDNVVVGGWDLGGMLRKQMMVRCNKFLSTRAGVAEKYGCGSHECRDELAVFQ